MPGAKRAAKRQRSTAKRSNPRVKKHRDKLRAAGLKPIQLWVWDPTRPGFAEQIRRECALANFSPDSQRVLEEIEALTDFEGWK